MSENNEQPVIRKIWLMLKRASPPIVPTKPSEKGALDSEYGILFDAQWNTANGHDKNATNWEYIKGTNSCKYQNMIVTNGLWVDKNYLQLDGTGKVAPTTTGQFAINGACDLYIVDGIGQVFTKYKKNGNYSRTDTLTVYEDKVVLTAYRNVTIDVPGKDVRMIYVYVGSENSRLVVFTADGKYYNAYSTSAYRFQNNSYSDTATFFNGFIGKVYAIKWELTYNGYYGLTKSNSSPDFNCLIAEFNAAKERFKF